MKRQCINKIEKNFNRLLRHFALLQPS